MNEEQKSASPVKVMFVFFICCILIFLFIASCNNHSKPTKYKSLNDATEQEIADFLEWESKHKDDKKK